MLPLLFKFCQHLALLQQISNRIFFVKLQVTINNQKKLNNVASESN